ncbi:MAG TPA: glucosamine-6-phosphate deaminase [Candidatus Methylomirabilis sp.]|nr:glucosamine-6-phosphate deaminase [Candidatus Methylomirabilis sp.]
MHVSVQATAEAMAKAAAEKAASLLRDAIARNGKAAFIAATGASQFSFLHNLVAARGIPWERTTMFHLDEYIGFTSEHPASFRRYLRERLTSRVPIGTVHFIEGDARDLEAEIVRLNGLLAATPIDVAFVGIGENGHLAFNDPPADFTTETPYLIVNLDEACRRQQFGEGWFKTLEDVPRRAISMSVRQIMSSASIICTVPERRKARAVKACLEGEIGPMVPASILRMHPRCYLYLDREAAGELSPATLSAQGKS